MDSRSYQDALVKLGDALDNEGWKPPFPVGAALSDENPGRIAQIKLLAMLFIATHQDAICSAICEGTKVKKGVEIGTEVAAHVAAHLSGLDWLSAAIVAPLASALCASGLSDFCQRAGG